MVVAGTQSSNDFANDINGSTFNVQRAQEDAHPAGPVGPGLNSPTISSSVSHTLHCHAFVLSSLQAIQQLLRR